MDKWIDSPAVERHDAASEEKTMIGLAQDFDLHSNQIEQWLDQLLEGATGVFGDGPKGEAEPVIDVNTLHAKIGELTLEIAGSGNLARGAEW